MTGMFYGCSALTILDVSNFNTNNVGYMRWMFYDCSSLSTIYCNDTWNCDNSSSMFEKCTSLKGAIDYNENNIDASFANPNTGYFKAVFLGDVDGNGEILCDDVKAVDSYIMGTMPSKFVFKGADANGDGKINVADIVTINNIIGGE